MNLKWHKRFYKIGLLNVGYENKLMTPALRILQPFIHIFEGVLMLILLPTPFMPTIGSWILRKIIKAQCRIKISEFDKNKKTQP